MLFFHHPLHGFFHDCHHHWHPFFFPGFELTAFILTVIFGIMATSVILFFTVLALALI